MTMAGRTAAIYDRRLDAIIGVEAQRFQDRMKRSAKMAEYARQVLAGGVTSNWQITEPHAIWIDHGRGSHLIDVDGNEYVDLHGGYGAMLAGHAHPAIVSAVTDRVALGTHFAQPVPDAVPVATELASRYGQPLWRFGNSGTEATMDAVHLMRAVTGRDRILKFEGAYHGHHDSVQVSSWVDDLDELGDPRRPHSAPASSGIPAAIVELTVIAPFNDLEAVAEIFEEMGDELAGVIIEPVLMNCGIVLPEPGFLEGLRTLTTDHGALLTFDEVKTGLTLGRGGATRRFGVQPDIVCLAKALGGGLPISAIGGTHEVMGAIVDGRYDQVGTFNGNPLSLAAAKAMLCDIMTEENQRRLAEIEQRMGQGARAVIDEYELPAYVVTVGAKGCVTYSTSTIRNYRDSLAVDERFSYAAWLTQFNRGVFLPPWTKGEQWLTSVQHTDADVDLYLETFESFAKTLHR